MANQARYYQTTAVITLTAAGQNADASHVDVLGAKAVSWSVSANNAGLLSTCIPQMIGTDDKQLTLVTGDNAAPWLFNVSAALTATDLSTATPRIMVLRNQVGNAPYGDGVMPGIKAAWLTLTKTAAGSTTYTVVTTVYY